MPRSTGDPFEGRISAEVLGSPFEYRSPRGYGWITDPAKITFVLADPLSRAVLAEFAALSTAGMLPVGPRGIGYRLLGRTVDGRTVVKDKSKIDTTGMDTAARRRHLAGFYDFADIGDTITTLRRCRALDWDWVADGRTDQISPLVAVNAAEVKARLRSTAARFGPDILHDQPVHVECWCEAADLAQLVGTLLAPYGIEVFSGSGDIPTGAILTAAGRYGEALDDGRDVTVLIIGDFDVDGLGNADRFVEDAEAFLDPVDQDRVDWRWIAPRPEHLTRWDAELRPAAGPASESRGWAVPFTLQAEALVRDNILRTILTEAVEGVLDMVQVGETRLNWRRTERPAIDAALS